MLLPLPIDIIGWAWRPPGADSNLAVASSELGWTICPVPGSAELEWAAMLLPAAIPAAPTLLSPGGTLLDPSVVPRRDAPRGPSC